MFAQASGIVLREHSNFLNMRIGHVAECKVDTSVASCNGHCTDRSSAGQLFHSVAVTAG